MVKTQVEARDVHDTRVLAAMRKVPRHRFVPAAYQAEAYADGPLPIGSGQTISQPYIVGLMSALLHVRPGDRILEVGTGCGYQAAVLCELGAEVDSVEIVPELSAQATATLAELNYPARLHVGDGASGVPERAPFQGIVLTAAPTEVPSALFDQLAEGGRLVAPVGEQGGEQQLLVFTKHSDHFEVETIIPVRFVPMVPGR